MADPTPRPFWMPDMPGFISLIMVIAVVGLTTLLAFRDPTGDMFKFMVGGLMTVGFSNIVQFYFGSSVGSKSKDDAIIGQMAPAKNPPNPPAPAATIAPWWSLLTDDERKAISSITGDNRALEFQINAKIGRADFSDLAYLVKIGALTQARADAIAAS